MLQELATTVLAFVALPPFTMTILRNLCCVTVGAIHFSQIQTKKYTLAYPFYREKHYSFSNAVFSIFGAIAEFERQIIRERTNAGLTAARARGRRGGRKEQHNSKKISTAVKLADTSPDTIADICKHLGISRSTYYRRRADLLN